MNEEKMTFAAWIKFEAERIVRMGCAVPEEHRSDYIYAQIHGALRKAFAHGRGGLTEDDPPRFVSKR